MTCWTSGGVLVVVLVVLRFCVYLGISGRPRSWPLGADSGPGEGVFGGGPGGPGTLCEYLFSAELSHSFKVSSRRRRRRNTQKSAQNLSESLCVVLWVPCRIFWVWFCPALGPIPVRNRRYPAGSFKVFGVLLVQPSSFQSVEGSSPAGTAYFGARLPASRKAPAG